MYVNLKIYKFEVSVHFSNWVWELRSPTYSGTTIYYTLSIVSTIDLYFCMIVTEVLIYVIMIVTMSAWQTNL